MAGISRPRNTREALRLKAQAKQKRADGDALQNYPAEALVGALQADQMDRLADDFLALPEADREVGRGGELVPPGAVAPDVPGLVSTVRSSPDQVTAYASLERLDLAAEAGALDLAVDTAETIQADNSLEKMLAHQLAAAHSLAMKLAGRAARHSAHALEERLPPALQDRHAVEAARAASAASRMMRAFNEGLLTLDRLRYGARQVVTVQYVNVADGGHAVVAGALSPGKGRGSP